MAYWKGMTLNKPTTTSTNWQGFIVFIHTLLRYAWRQPMYLCRAKGLLVINTTQITKFKHLGIHKTTGFVLCTYIASTSYPIDTKYLFSNIISLKLDTKSPKFHSAILHCRSVRRLHLRNERSWFRIPASAKNPQKLYIHYIAFVTSFELLGTYYVQQN
jgi:hypothetical protein